MPTHSLPWGRETNVERLDEALRQALGAQYAGLSWDGTTLRLHGPEGSDPLTEKQLADVERVLSTHDPDELSERQRQTVIAEEAPERARAIPGWATWDEAQAVAYIENNVKDLASAKIVLVAMARLLVALRDAQWPGLDIEG